MRDYDDLFPEVSAWLVKAEQATYKHTTVSNLEWVGLFRCANANSVAETSNHVPRMCDMIYDPRKMW